jgi:formylmethanofuran dehydrogenase subunit E
MKRRYKVAVGTVLRSFVIDAESEFEAQEEGKRLFDVEIDKSRGMPQATFSNNIVIKAVEMWVCERCGEDFGRPKFMTIRTNEDGSQRFLCLLCAKEEDKAA